MFNKNTVGSSEIAVKIGNFLQENPNYRRRFLRRLNNFNKTVKDIVSSTDLRPETKLVLFDTVYSKARHSANYVGKISKNDIKESYPAYLLITYFKTVFDNTMPYLQFSKNEQKRWSKLMIPSHKHKLTNEIRKIDIMNQINVFIEKKVEILRKI
jgi:hypothetical protein